MITLDEFLTSWFMWSCLYGFALYFILFCTKNELKPCVDYYKIIDAHLEKGCDKEVILEDLSRVVDKAHFSLTFLKDGIKVESHSVHPLDVGKLIRYLNFCNIKITITHVD